MKYALLSIIFSFSAGAVTLEKSVSDPRAALVQGFILGKETTRWKTTNRFDRDLSDLRLGTFRLLKDEPAAGKLRRQLELLAKKIEAAEREMKKIGKDWNSTNEIKGHRAVYRLNGFIIYPELDSFKEIEGAYENLVQFSWKHIQGVVPSPDLKVIREVSAGKVIKESPYRSETLCSNDTDFRDCLIPDQGLLRITKGKL